MPAEKVKRAHGVLAAMFERVLPGASDPVQDTCLVRSQGGRDNGPGPIPIQDSHNRYTGDYCTRVAINNLCS